MYQRSSIKHLQIRSLWQPLARGVRAIRSIPSPRFSLPLALLLSILQNSPVADTRQQAQITLTIAPKTVQELAGSGGRDSLGQKRLLHRICAPESLKPEIATTAASSHRDSAQASQLIEADTSPAALRACGGQRAYLLTTRLKDASSAPQAIELNWVSI